MTTTERTISRGELERTDPAPTERRGWLASLGALVLGVAFLGSGLSKLVGPDFLVSTFEAWGYTAWFMRVIGIVEVLGAVLVLIPAVRVVGAGVIGAVMIGALATHLAAGEWLLSVVPVLVLALAVALVWPPSPFGPIERPRTHAT